jgi:hypothetical protein
MEPARSSVRSNLLLDLPEELLQLIYRTIGLGDALNTLVASHELHVQWQQAVRYVTVSSSQFTVEDVAELCKLVRSCASQGEFLCTSGTCLSGA